MKNLQDDASPCKNLQQTCKFLQVNHSKSTRGCFGSDRTDFGHLGPDISVEADLNKRFFKLSEKELKCSLLTNSTMGKGSKSK